MTSFGLDFKGTDRGLYLSRFSVSETGGVGVFEGSEL